MTIRSKIGLFVTSVAVLLTACTKAPGTSVPSNLQSSNSPAPSSSVQSVNRVTSESQSSSNSVSTTSGNGINNPYFFNGTSKQTYKGTFLFKGEFKENIAVTLNITKLASLKGGILYCLKIDPVDGVPNDRLDLGYYYVLQNKIYKIDSEDTQKNIDALENSGTIPDGSAIVCQEDELKDSLGSDAKGWHQSIEANGDKRLYKSYNNSVETSYYENISWQQTKGITEYRSGYGAERDSMDLKKE